MPFFKKMFVTFIKDANVSTVIGAGGINKSFNFEVLVCTLHRTDDAKESRDSITRWLLSRKKYSKNVEASNGLF